MLTQPTCLLIHGAGQKSSKQRFTDLTAFLSHKGVTAISFDHSGHGENSGEFTESTIKKRVEEASAAYQLLDKTHPITVCGFSMGGYEAIKIAERHKVDNLILCCPAVYDVRAYDVPFDERLTAVLRRPDSWKHTDAGTILETFIGNLLVIIGENDTVIPKGVIQMIDFSARRASSKKIITLPGQDHWLMQTSDTTKEIASYILSLISH